MKLSKHLGGGKLGLKRYYFRLTDTDSWNQWWYPTGTKRFLKLREVSQSIVELYVLYLA